MKSSLFLSLALLSAAAVFAPAAQAQSAYCAKPFQHYGSVVLNQGYSGAIGDFTVPAGYRLKIEYVSAGLRLSTNDGRSAFAILTTAGGASTWHSLPILTGYALNDRMTSSAVSLYADPGTAVRVEINRNSGTNLIGYGRFSVTGCLYPAI